MPFVGEVKDLGFLERMKASRNAFEHVKDIDPHGTLITMAHLAAGVGLGTAVGLGPALVLPAHKEGRKSLIPDRDNWVDHAASWSRIGAAAVVLITAGSQITHGRSPLTQGVAPIYGLAVGVYGASLFATGQYNNFMKN